MLLTHYLFHSILHIQIPRVPQAPRHLAAAGKEGRRKEGKKKLLHFPRYCEFGKSSLLLLTHTFFSHTQYPAVKFVQSVSTNCIPNYPDKNVPTVFIYLEVGANRIEETALLCRRSLIDA